MIVIYLRVVIIVQTDIVEAFIAGTDRKKNGMETKSVAGPMPGTGCGRACSPSGKTLHLIMRSGGHSLYILARIKLFYVD